MNGAAVLCGRVLVSAAGSGTSFNIITRVPATWGQQAEIPAADIYPAHVITALALADHYVVLPLIEIPASSKLSDR